jgi:hypothetical protein
MIPEEWNGVRGFVGLLSGMMTEESSGYKRRNNRIKATGGVPIRDSSKA